MCAFSSAKLDVCVQSCRIVFLLAKPVICGIVMAPRTGLPSRGGAFNPAKTSGDINPIKGENNVTSLIGGPLRDRERPAPRRQLQRHRQAPEGGPHHRPARNPEACSPRRQGREGSRVEPLHPPRRMQPPFPVPVLQPPAPEQALQHLPPLQRRLPRLRGDRLREARPSAVRLQRLRPRERLRAPEEVPCRRRRPGGLREASVLGPRGRGRDRRRAQADVRHAGRGLQEGPAPAPHREGVPRPFPCERAHALHLCEHGRPDAWSAGPTCPSRRR